MPEKVRWTNDAAIIAQIPMVPTPNAQVPGGCECVTYAFENMVNVLLLPFANFKLMLFAYATSQALSSLLHCLSMLVMLFCENQIDMA